MLAPGMWPDRWANMETAAWVRAETMRFMFSVGGGSGSGDGEGITGGFAANGDGSCISAEPDGG